MSYLLAPALVTLRAQFDQKFPNRSKASDGWIGDAAHRSQGSASDHNPWVVIDGQAYVTALDITNHPAIGLDLNAFTDQLQVACRDQGENRLKYAIHRALLMDTRPQFRPYQWDVKLGALGARAFQRDERPAAAGHADLEPAHAVGHCGPRTCSSTASARWSGLASRSPRARSLLRRSHWAG